MKLIADSGSTKTDWVLIDAEPFFFTSPGLNPNILEDQVIVQELQKITALTENKSAITEIYFYGAGCASPENCTRLASIFKEMFPDTVVVIKSDIDGAAYAANNGKPGIVAILGTGSNSCFFDGEKIFGGDFSMGYILGDEGSGSYFGKRLLRDYFYRILPEELYEAFKAKYHIVRNDVIEKVYRNNAPNEFIASFLPFYKEHIQHPYCTYFINFGLEEFIKIYIWRFSNYKAVDVNFVGSVAFHFEEQLRAVCAKLTIKPGRIIASPIQGLLQYHNQ